MNDEPILCNLSQPPKAGKNELYRWCDYIELRCLTHVDKRFSRDAFSEALGENVDLNADDVLDVEVFEADDESLADPEVSVGDQDMEVDVPRSDKEEGFSALCFRQLRWRQKAFGDGWPFRLDEQAQEIQLCAPLNSTHILYLQLLLSSSLNYCHSKRWRELTGKFEKVSLTIFRHLMPKGAEVHAFGAAESQRYRGHLYDKLCLLAEDIRGNLSLEKHHFAKEDNGDGGLDVVAWHPLGDTRKGIPIALGQCGCTATGWPNKMLEASPSHLAGHLHTMHEWDTYYFMPLDLSDEHEGQMDWQKFSDFGRAIVIDRLRFMRLADAHGLFGRGISAVVAVTEAAGMRLT